MSARLTPLFLWSGSRPWISLRAGTGRAPPFTVATTARPRARGLVSLLIKSPGRHLSLSPLPARSRPPQLNTTHPHRPHRWEAGRVCAWVRIVLGLAPNITPFAFSSAPGSRGRYAFAGSRLVATDNSLTNRERTGPHLLNRRDTQPHVSRSSTSEASAPFRDHPS